MEDKSRSRTWFELLWFNLISFGVTLIQLGLVNLFLYLMRNDLSPVPGYLYGIFNQEMLGKGNARMGYVLPFFLSNMIANTVGYFQNRKTTFRSDSPKRYVLIFIAVVLVLIICSTWVQGRIVYEISRHAPALQPWAPTIAALAAGLLQFAVLFPLEKYVLFRKKED